MKNIIIAPLILLVTSPLFSGELIGTGLKIGYNSSKFVGEDLPGKSISSQPGISFGGFISYNLDSRSVSHAPSHK